MKRKEWGWMVEGRRAGGGGVIAPDAHTPTPTNYYCVVENEDEEETEAPQTQMSRFVRFRPQRQIKNREGGQVTSYVSPSGKLCPGCSSVGRHSQRHLALIWTQLCKVRWYTAEHRVQKPLQLLDIFSCPQMPFVFLRSTPLLESHKHYTGRCQHPHQPITAWGVNGGCQWEGEAYIVLLTDTCLWAVVIWTLRSNSCVSGFCWSGDLLEFVTGHFLCHTRLTNHS